MVYNRIRVAFGALKRITGPTINYQYDVKQILVINGLDLPEYYVVDFCNEGDATVIPMTGTSDGVEIPDSLLQTGKPVKAYIVVSSGQGDIQTRYEVKLPVNTRPMRDDVHPTDSQQQQIDALVDALNNGVDRAEDAADRADEAAEAFTHPTASAETLAPDAPATATYNDGHFTFGIPKGDKGDKLTYADLTEADKLDLIQGPIADAQEAAEQAVEDKGQEVLDSLPQDYIQLEDHFESLKDNIVLVQDTQPSSPDNRIWVDPDDNEIEIPTMDEFTTLSNALNGIEEMENSPIPFMWEHGGIDNSTGNTNNDGSLTRSRDLTYYSVDELVSVKNDSTVTLWIIFYTYENNTYTFQSSISVTAGNTYTFTSGQYVRFDVRGGFSSAALVTGLIRYKIVRKIETIDSQLFHGKNNLFNTPAGFTYFSLTSAGYSSSNKMTPANLPKNSYAFAIGNTLDNTKFPSGIKYTAGDTYWICRLSNTSTVTSTGNISWYIIKEQGSGSVWFGSTSDGGTSMQWMSMIDKTLTLSGIAADAKTVGTNFYHNKTRTYLMPAGFTYFDSGNAGYSSSNKMTPANLPKNSYTYTIGERLDNTTFPSNLTYTASGAYWIYRFSNTSSATTSGNISWYIIRDQNSDKVWFGSTVNGGTNVTWREIAVNVTNNYTTEYFENTYNIDCSPSITSGTNNYLASTGDTTDRTGAIQTMLNETGICQLGPGDFYVTGIEVPTYRLLTGSGNRTRIILASSVTTGYAVKLKTGSAVSNMRIYGGTSAPALSSTVGTRHGIVWEGTMTPGSESGTTCYRGQVSNCIVMNFEGGGITFRGTGLSPTSNVLVSDCFFSSCTVGINIAYYSEFNRISNCAAHSCYYGCIDNGGNNNFSNCDFSENKMQLLIDNATNQSPNNTHGTFSACSFNHSENNSGTAIRILGANAGEVFTGCQIFFGGIEIDNSTGIRFVGANMGNNVPITVTNSSLVVFSDCTIRNNTSSPLTQSGNTALLFKDCYMRDGSVYAPQ